MKKAVKVVFWVAVIGLVVFLTLFFAARIAQFNSIGDMLSYIWAQVF